MTNKAFQNSNFYDRVKSGLKKSNKSQPDLLRFSDLFLSGLDERQPPEFSEESLINLIIEEFHYIQKRPSNAHKIRTYDIKKDGKDLASKNIAQETTVIAILNDDMPFLVDSVIGEIQEHQFELFQVNHPILHTQRNNSGELVQLLNSEEIESEELPKLEGYLRESFIYIQLEALSDQRKKDLITSISEILDSVRMAVADWRSMLVRITQAVAEYTESPPPVDVIQLTESVQFMKWLTDNHFTFLGMREYEFIGGAENGELHPKQGTSLGILRNPETHVLRDEQKEHKLSEQVRSFFLSPEPLIITKSNVRSKVHRRIYMDYIGIKIYDEQGKITGELRVVGLFTSVAYTRAPARIPFLRHKVETVIRRYGKHPSSHGTKALQNVLDTFPRDELFQIGAEKLYETAIGIHALELIPRACAFIREDEFNRFVSALVFVPRDTFSTETRQMIGEMLAETFEGRVSAFYPYFTEGPLVRIHFIIGRSKKEKPVYDHEKIEQEINRILRNWSDDLKEALTTEFLPSKAGLLFLKYKKAFPVGYEELMSTGRAIQDITRIEKLTDEQPVAIDFYHDNKSENNEINVSIYHLEKPIPLSQRVPILENFGFSVIDERSYRVNPRVEDQNPVTIFLHNMILKSKDRKEVDLENNAIRLEQGFLSVWQKLTESDIYNHLILKLGISWQEVSVVRAIGAYLRQIRVPFSKRYIGETLLRHNNITMNIIELFRLRCDPDLPISLEGRQKSQTKLIQEIEKDLSNIPSLDEDRIFRYFLDILCAIQRTSFYQSENNQNESNSICFKLNSKQIDLVPDPKPFAEIYVYAPHFEGIHLRGGKISRGGLRWSDRQQDFRTEVLGLAKAQQVKNTVIVPAGAKGGFVPKKIPDTASREERISQGTECYKSFISGLLSITDNLKENKIVPPDRVVRHDEDDPYLVVAADKGTATFSDTANAISQQHDFWLDDAFASGGSAGYDHKKMGITARGAWESVKRHFREIDRDIQNEPFTAIGVGDMSGDVFGNGMILSKSTRLIAAFDHRDIFIDPDPTQERSWLERKRLFEMQRSSWQDYNQELISEGGGIFSRQAKSIPLTDEIRKIISSEKDELTPDELIHALLKSEVDLLWFGGIGTYIRAENERDDEIGDRANDAIRVSASELNVKVIGEGANLGMTHKARIEFAIAGGRVNSDAIDNSAGVNSSDLEVNIKIALRTSMNANKMSLEQRDELLENMTEEVAEACLRNNYLQSLAISLGHKRGTTDLSFQKKLMNDLEKSGLLDRELEFLPNDSEIAERLQNGNGLTRPELAVLLAYAKIDLFNKLIESNLPGDEFLSSELIDYFPKTLVDNIPDEILNHRLKREIIATQLSNAIINRGGSTMIVRIKDETNQDLESIAYAFVVARAVFDLEAVYAEIDALDTKVSGATQLELYLRVQDLLRHQVSWFLHNIDLNSGLSEIIKIYKSGLQQLDKFSKDYIHPTHLEELKAKCTRYENVGVPSSLATQIIGLKFLENGPDIILVANNSNSEIELAAKVFNKVSEVFDLYKLRKQAAALESGGYFDRIAINSALNDISSIQRQISEQIIKQFSDDEMNIEKWIENNKSIVERTQHAMTEILSGEEFSIAKLTVGVSHLRELS